MLNFLYLSELDLYVFILYHLPSDHSTILNGNTLFEIKIRRKKVNTKDNIPISTIYLSVGTSLYGKGCVGNDHNHTLNKSQNWVNIQDGNKHMTVGRIILIILFLRELYPYTVVAISTDVQNRIVGRIV